MTMPTLSAWRFSAMPRVPFSNSTIFTGFDLVEAVGRLRDAVADGKELAKLGDSASAPKIAIWFLQNR